MATEYDSNILQEYADQLYRQAKGIVFRMAVSYGALTFLVLFLFFGIFGSHLGIDRGIAIVFVLPLTAMAIYTGVKAGRNKTFALKLQAQELLCQRQIELNTRSADQGSVLSGEQRAGASVG